MHACSCHFVEIVSKLQEVAYVIPPSCSLLHDVYAVRTEKIQIKCLQPFIYNFSAERALVLFYLFYVKFYYHSISVFYNITAFLYTWYDRDYFF